MSRRERSAMDLRFQKVMGCRRDDVLNALEVRSLKAIEPEFLIHTKDDQVTNKIDHSIVHDILHIIQYLPSHTFCEWSITNAS